MPDNTEICPTLALSTMPTKVLQTIYSKAPTRIDLAGGTVDLWPLYLFLDQPVTLNVGIDLFAEARLEISSVEGRKNQGEVLLKSEDQNLEMKVPWDTLNSFLGAEQTQAPPALELHFRLLRHFLLKRAEHVEKNHPFNLSLSTRARSPAGAGLGGSSTLSVAMVGALATWVEGNIQPKRDGVRLVEIVRDVETTVIHVPAGVQDYYGAMFGGLQSLRWKAGSHQREWLPSSVLEGLQQRLLLFYSGKSRNSGINNWALFKAFIDGEGEVRVNFQKIVAATRSLEDALRKKDWSGAGASIAEEWSVRKTLAKGITTPEIERAFERARKIAPEISGKVCGAGGGGCFFLFLPSGDPAVREAIIKTVTQKGIQSLPFHVSPHGLQVQQGKR